MISLYSVEALPEPNLNLGSRLSWSELKKSISLLKVIKLKEHEGYDRSPIRSFARRCQFILCFQTDEPVLQTRASFEKVLQSIWHQINSAEEVFVVGTIQEDKTVKGGTGWGAEFAKLCNKPLYVFDQEKKNWFQWVSDNWEETEPRITKNVSRERVPVF